jgi:protein-S-isoprenylcysteine O-methyltransferase Ste14
LETTVQTEAQSPSQVQSQAQSPFQVHTESHSPVQAQPGPNRENPGMIAPPPLVYLGGLGVGFALQALLPPASIPAAIGIPAGATLAVAGGVLARSFFRAFVRAGTPVSPFRAPTKLDTSGPYRLTRNPGYLGMALAYAGIALLAGAPWALLPLPVVLALIDRGVIVREERYLRRHFGEEYARYAGRTRRWI